MSLVEEKEVRCKLRNAATVLETTWPTLALYGYLSEGHAGGRKKGQI